MTLLEQIIKASTNPDHLSIESLKYPINFNPNPISPILQPSKNPNFYPLIQPLNGFKISETDLGIIDLNSNFVKKLKRKLKDSHSFDLLSFIDLLNVNLKKIGEKKCGVLVDLDLDCVGSDYSCKLIEKFGSFVGKDVIELIIEGCLILGVWDLLETLIVNNVVDYAFRSDLLFNLMGKNRSDLICLCVRCFSDVGSMDLCRVLKYFLSPSKDGLVSMGSVGKEWEDAGLVAIEKVSDKKLSGKKSGLAKEASMLLMVAYDGFSSSELCLHFLLSCSSVDDVVFSSAISKLNVEEILGLIRYLGKWLRKYERFPQVGPCPKAVCSLGLKMCQWVPKIEDVVKCYGLVVDEHFSSLSMRSEFHEDLIAIEEVVSSLVCEGRSSSSVANLIDILKPEVGGA